jgi:hypothetical protein
MRFQDELSMMSVRTIGCLSVFSKGKGEAGQKEEPVRKR